MKRKIRDSKRGAQLARKQRTARLINRSSRPRLVVYRTARHIYAQLQDPVSGRTIGAASTRSKEVSSGLAATGNVEAAKKVGEAIAKVAQQNQIEAVVFNRNGFLYHGRVKALAEAAREAGLQF